MAIGDESSSSSTVLSIGTSEDVQSFNFVHDNPNLKINSQLLDGLNHVRWAQSAKLFVGGRGKIGFLFGTEKEPAESNPKYTKWYILNERVMLGSSNFPIRLGILNRVLRLWGCIMQDFDRVGKNYLIMITSSSGQLAHQVKRFLLHLQQQRFMRRLWRRLRCFSSLAGLNPDFKYARVHQLDGTHFPTLEEVHAYCLSDQRRRSPMPPISGIPSETFAMVVRYAYLVPPLVPSQTSHTSSPSLSP
ncbi:hypothetical protein GIB67_032432 [Kingdonia uniflora]|uniref:Retrotransposon Copia-like N-terminal domain-containing protein n=1 Tax=Kingdonia uniflora TaxID=39325 RepID=A0A7J7MJ43_9MAGN|nr:hypothetical protein GIB67_032432 [Kingdonia uniflora]